jgi:hypothetical protein
MNVPIPVGCLLNLASSVQPPERINKTTYVKSDSEKWETVSKICHAIETAVVMAGTEQLSYATAINSDLPGRSKYYLQPT